MANFEISFLITNHNEGGFADNPADNGKMTYCGISRKFWPNWKGWPIIDAIKINHGTDAHTINIWASKNPQLQTLIKDFYKTNFWDVNSLDKINDQKIANNIYDCGVNCGVGIAAEFLQLAAMVNADRKIGPETIQAVNRGYAPSMYNFINAKRKAYYEELITRNPSQKQFEHSWMSRLEPYDS